MVTPLLESGPEGGALRGASGLYPLGRLGKPEEVSALISFLLSDEASISPGATISSMAAIGRDVGEGEAYE